MWWSLPIEMPRQLYAKFVDGQDAVYTWDWGESRTGPWRPGDRGTSINRYTVDFVRTKQEHVDNGRKRTIRLIWVRPGDVTPTY